MNVLLAATAGGIFAVGTYLVIQRKLSRIIIGLSLLTHGANVLFLLAGRRGEAPLVGTSDPADFSDPLPQAMALTAIVIAFGVTGFLLALAYRSWILTSDDEVEDDVTDRLVGLGRFSDKDVKDSQADDTGDHDESVDADPEPTGSDAAVPEPALTGTTDASESGPPATAPEDIDGGER